MNCYGFCIFQKLYYGNMINLRNIIQVLLVSIIYCSKVIQLYQQNNHQQQNFQNQTNNSGWTFLYKKFFQKLYRIEKQISYSQRIFSAFVSVQSSGKREVIQRISRNPIKYFPKFPDYKECSVIFELEGKHKVIKNYFQDQYKEQFLYSTITYQTTYIQNYCNTYEIKNKFSKYQDQSEIVQLISFFVNNVIYSLPLWNLYSKLPFRIIQCFQLEY
ncbi:unnamed protein product [Paramecium pentaurelia]|uniref:Uncharacterized protein n=1 Tax=Paramecium pentaurelia TaxID=43138 RepID=A0A8S1YLM6_9CILI|nr:unnamed protein product [Paramecium pentaurelia]